MVLKQLIGKIDKTLCSYLGLEREETCPTAVQMVGDRLLITKTASYKRHLMKESWNNFSVLDMGQTSPENRERLGLAAGKAIAKNLVVSFEEFPIAFQNQETLNNVKK